MRSSVLAELDKRIRNKSARIGIMGMGYVGLPLATEFAESGFSVTGIDLNEERVKQVNAGASYIPDVSGDQLTCLVTAKRLSAVSGYEVLSELDVIIMCVPTPLRKTRDPDISFIVAAAEQIAKHARPGQLIILESTTYPGTTQEVILPLLQSDGSLKAGQDFCLAFSPERVDPGNVQFPIKRIPKVIGGVTPTCQQMAMQLYRQIMQRVVSVSSPTVAEMVKLFENTFRAVNIALANEMALLCNRLGIDVWEIVDAAKTKPFGFMAFYPGPGIGGHCIPKDPMYLAWKARLHGFEPRLIDLADQINRQMPHHVVGRVAQALNDRKKSLNGAHILLIGLAYKKDVNDMRESPTFEVAEALVQKGASVSYHDPYIPSAAFNGNPLHSTALSPERLQATDCVVLLTNHTSLDYDQILQHAPLIVDTRHQYGLAQQRNGHVVGL
ncbi:MAG: nucleotide sugar dehydrogenase [Candidatus Omnitrophica bacterium]|nr:nucleotide sugar dehydrogenase [Candidatus Omnitrophota bacterium]